MAYCSARLDFTCGDTSKSIVVNPFGQNMRSVWKIGVYFHRIKLEAIRIFYEIHKTPFKL